MHLPAPGSRGFARGGPAGGSFPSLLVELPGCPPLTLLLDPETARIREVQGLPGPGGGTETWSDYGEAHGLWFARRRERRLPDGRILTLRSERVALGHFAPPLFHPANDPPEPAGQEGPGWGSGDVPMELRDGHVYVPARIGDGPVRTFVVDSAATDSLFSASAVEGVPASDRPELVYGTIGGSGRARRVAIPFLRIGTLELRDFHPGAADVERAGGAVEKGVAGILGGELFQNFVVCPDYPRRRFRVTSPRDFRPPPRVEPLPLILKNRLPFVRGSINGKGVDILLDTGHNRTVAVTVETARRAGIPVPLPGEAAPGEARGLLGVAAVLKSRADDVRLGAVADRNVVVQIASREVRGADVDALVGGGWFDRLTVIFDFPAGRVFLWRSGG